MEEMVNFRSWDELIPDALGLIFSNLSLQERLTVVPRVCKAWGKVVAGPYCWKEIDIEEWCHRSEPSNIDRMLRMLIARSGGSARRLCVSGLDNDLIFSFIAENAGALQSLRLPRSNISDSIVEQVAENFSKITFWDLSYCGKIGARALEIIGNHCKFLVGLRRNMHPLNMESNNLSQVDEARAIATTMPKLKHLEMAYLLINTESVLEIVAKCTELELLDLRGCWNVKIDEKHFEREFPKLKVLGPHVDDQYERRVWDDYSDYSDSIYGYESFDGMWGDEGNLELMFYEEFDEDDIGYDWPPSP